MNPDHSEADKHVFLGSTQKDIRALDPGVQRQMGFAIDMAKRGEHHQDAKIMQGYSVGGDWELVALGDRVTYRLVYWVGCTGYTFILHVFAKKSHSGSAIPKPDREMIVHRLQAAVRLCKELNPPASKRRSAR